MSKPNALMQQTTDDGIITFAQDEVPVICWAHDVDPSNVARLLVPIVNSLRAGISSFQILLGIDSGSLKSQATRLEGMAEEYLTELAGKGERFELTRTSDRVITVTRSPSPRNS